MAYPTLAAKAINWLNKRFKNVYGTFGTDIANLLRGQRDVSEKAANGTTYTLAITDTGTVYDNTGATGYAIFNLPEASTWIGKTFEFHVTVAQNLDINAYSGDTIIGLADAAGDAIRNATIGGSVTLRALNSSTIGVVSAVGTWTDVN